MAAHEIVTVYLASGAEFDVDITATAEEGLIDLQDCEAVGNVIERLREHLAVGYQVIEHRRVADARQRVLFVDQAPVAFRFWVAP